MVPTPLSISSRNIPTMAPPATKEEETEYSLEHTGHLNDHDADPRKEESTHSRILALMKDQKNSESRLLDSDGEEVVSHSSGSSPAGTTAASSTGSTTTDNSKRYLPWLTKKGASSSSATSYALKEARWVQMSKRSVIVFLILLTAACALATYFVTTKSQDASFEEQYYGLTDEIIRVSNLNMESVYASIGSMAVTVSSYALDTNKTWPFVTIPHFELRGAQLLKLSGARYVSLNVLVTEDKKLAWENYSIQHESWIQQGLDVRGDGAIAEDVPPHIHKGMVMGADDTLHYVPDEGPADPYYGVTWQLAPAPKDPSLVNFNSMSTRFGELVERMLLMRQEVLSQVVPVDDDENMWDETAEGQADGGHEDDWTPHSFLVQPIFQDPSGAAGDSPIVGYLSALLPWANYFIDVSPDEAPMQVVLSNTCGQTATLEIRGPKVEILSADEDVHDTRFEHLEVSAHFHSDQDFSNVGCDEDHDEGGLVNGTGCIEGHSEEAHALLSQGDEFYCWFEMSIYPTQEFYISQTSNAPIYTTIGVVFIFLLTSLVFLTHDVIVTRRQAKIEQHAARSNAIVSSLFPEQVRQRLMEDSTSTKQRSDAKSGTQPHESSQAGLHLSGAIKNDPSNSLGPLSPAEEVTANLLRTKPIADLFPNASVLFADICGFTAWSSTREPVQVFTLLEQIYNHFDLIARRRRIFKVETIGDCYVAAAGLPEARNDHAVALARFAHECLSNVHTIVTRLEILLGPGTGDLSMRFGIHSGPVTAGVLRGEKSRFQLFGDTVNTASRIETTGERGRIHLSEATARLLQKAGKKGWLQKRDNMVNAKGKGAMTTYWLILGNKPSAPEGSHVSNSLTTSENGDSIGSLQSLPVENGADTDGLKKSSTGIPYHHHHRSASKVQDEERMKRLVQWNVDVLQRFLKKIEAKRRSSVNKPAEPKVSDKELVATMAKGETVLDEFQEVIDLPQDEADFRVDPSEVTLDSRVLSQLDDYVSMICELYRKNSFHNFEHASHVTQSVAKLLSRIVTADDIDYEGMNYRKKTDIHQLHFYTYGLTSDPIIQFACAFSALIHDVDHSGVPNASLVAEGSEIAKLYKNKSVAEQNSVDLAWDLLMEDQFANLRNAIYQNAEELKRFRQLVVNMVLATDIADKELGALRKNRWDKAFQQAGKVDEVSVASRPLSRDVSSNQSVSSSALEDTNRKATIVIEHLIQASDIAHTMQHWHVYIKWNERLFHEMYAAFLEGRLPADPSIGWYQGELGFFDFYIIPLANKLKECGVFGVSSEEYLNYALQNRAEFELKGKEVVEGYMAVYNNQKAAKAVSRGEA